MADGPSEVPDWAFPDDTVADLAAVTDPLDQAQRPNPSAAEAARRRRLLESLQQGRRYRAVAPPPARWG